MDVLRPEGWITPPAGKHAYAMAEDKPGTSSSSAPC